jgi:hypothetical protein
MPLDVGEQLSEATSSSLDLPTPSTSKLSAWDTDEFRAFQTGSPSDACFSFDRAPGQLEMLGDSDGESETEADAAFDVCPDPTTCAEIMRMQLPAFRARPSSVRSSGSGRSSVSLPEALLTGLTLDQFGIRVEDRTNGEAQSFAAEVTIQDVLVVGSSGSGYVVYEISVRTNEGASMFSASWSRIADPGTKRSSRGSVTPHSSSFVKSSNAPFRSTSGPNSSQDCRRRIR